MAKPRATHAALLAALVILHLVIASERVPAPASYGTGIAGQTTSVMPATIRIAAWNIRRGKGLDGRRDLSRIAAELNDYDIVGLSEVGGAITGNHQAERLAQMLETGWQFTPSQRRWHHDYFGNAFLSRIAPLRWQSVPIIHDLERGVGHRHLQTIEYSWKGEKLAIVILHAERGPVRDRQIERAVREFNRYDNAVLLGDFNADIESAVIRNLLETPDINAALVEPDTVDWIFTRGLDIVEAGMIPPGASDHPLVWAEISLPDDDQSSTD